MSIPLASHAPPSLPAILRLGFRPFLLLAGLSGGLLILAWVYGLQGGVLAIADPVRWHGHAMIFGFTAAGITGFLLTAVVHWTGRPRPLGWGLAAPAGLWWAGWVDGRPG